MQSSILNNGVGLIGLAVYDLELRGYGSSFRGFRALAFTVRSPISPQASRSKSVLRLGLLKTRPSWNIGVRGFRHKKSQPSSSTAPNMAKRIQEGLWV